MKTFPRHLLALSTRCVQQHCRMVLALPGHKSNSIGPTSVVHPACNLADPAPFPPREEIQDTRSTADCTHTGYPSDMAARCALRLASNCPATPTTVATISITHTVPS